MADDNDTELELYINNDGKMYRDLTRPLQKRLAMEKAIGTYSRDRALKEFKQIAKDGAGRYRKEWGHSFDAKTQHRAARGMLDYFETEYRLGNMKP